MRKNRSPYLIRSTLRVNKLQLSSSRNIQNKEKSISNHTNGKFVHGLLVIMTLVIITIYHQYTVNVIIKCRAGFTESSLCRGSWVYAGFPGEVLHTRGGVFRPILPAGRFTERPSLFWEKT